MKVRSHWNADETACILTNRLNRQEPLSYWRFGDGLIELVKGKIGQTCDGEKYSADLAKELMHCFNAVVNSGPKYAMNVSLGDWATASFSGPRDPSRYEAQWELLLSMAHQSLQFMHFEALLFMRQSSALANFYRTLREDPRKKLYMGPEGNRDAATWLGAEFLPTPMTGLFAATNKLTDMLQVLDFEILVFGAGMAGNIPAIRTWNLFPEKTYINLGSALDPLFRGQSRRQQLTRAQARRLVGLPV